MAVNDRIIGQPGRVGLPSGGVLGGGYQQPSRDRTGGVAVDRGGNSNPWVIGRPGLPGLPDGVGPASMAGGVNNHGFSGWDPEKELGATKFMNQGMYGVDYMRDYMMNQAGPQIPDWYGDQLRGPAPYVQNQAYQTGSGPSFNPQSFNIQRGYQGMPGMGNPITGSNQGGMLAGLGLANGGNVDFNAYAAGGSSPQLQSLTNGDYARLEENLRQPGELAANQAFEKAARQLREVMSARGMTGGSLASQAANEGANRELMNALASNAAGAAAQRYQTQLSELQGLNQNRTADAASQRDLSGRLAAASAALQGDLARSAVAREGQWLGYDTDWGKINAGREGQWLGYDTDFAKLNQDDRQFGWKAGLTEAQRQQDYGQSQADFFNQNLKDRFNYNLAADQTRRDYTQQQFQNMLAALNPGTQAWSATQNALLQQQQIAAQQQAARQSSDAANTAAWLGLGGSVLGGLLGGIGSAQGVKNFFNW